LKLTSKVYAVTDHYSVYAVASVYEYLRISDIIIKKSIEESDYSLSESLTNALAKYNREKL